MQILNVYFTPFAAILIIFALYFSEPDKTVTFLSAGVLTGVTLANHFLSKRIYRFIQWTVAIRTGLVCLNLITSTVLFWLLGSYWAPMWLLFFTAPATAAMFMSRLSTLAFAVSASALMLGIYWLKGVEGGVFWGQAAVHASFILLFSLFVHALAQIALKIRDAAR